MEDNRLLGLLPVTLVEWHNHFFYFVNITTKKSKQKKLLRKLAYIQHVNNYLTKGVHNMYTSCREHQSWSKLVVNNKIKIKVFISISNYLVRRSIPALELGSKNVKRTPAIGQVLMTRWTKV